MVES
ncbi:hypothetical protein VCCP103710_1869, partial [Vibrio cholerae CP1037(10)]|jgi:hypothetical protein